MKCHTRDSGVLVSQFINSSAVRIVPINVENFIAVDLRVNSIHPTFDSVKGNMPVSFALGKRSMDVVTYCRFEEILVSTIGHSDTVTCITPPMNAIGQKQRQLTLTHCHQVDEMKAMYRESQMHKVGIHVRNRRFYFAKKTDCCKDCHQVDEMKAMYGEAETHNDGI
eukprot:scaffold232178_cov36-Cyclotella_meneghiniana.AAC.1